MVDISHPLAQQAADLVNEIERFPASDQQTRCVTLAAELVKSISTFCAPRQEEPGGIWDAVERAAARVPPWVGLPAQQAKSLTQQAALRVVPPEADDGAEADSFDAFHKALTDEAKQFGIDPTVVQALAAALTAPHAWLWSRLEAANRQADAYASTERDLRAKLQLLIDRPEVTPEGYYCFPDGDTWWRTSRPNE